jgi:hypothetical protein
MTIREISIQKNQKWPNTPKEFFNHRREGFKGYLINDMGHTREEVKILLEIWDLFINEENIEKYLNRSYSLIYTAMINQQMDTLPDYI